MKDAKKQKRNEWQEEENSIRDRKIGAERETEANGSESS